MAVTRPQLIRGTILCAVAWIFNGVATGLPFWWSTKVFSTNGTYQNIGLFRICDESQQCTGFSEHNRTTPDWVIGSQSCMVASVILVGLCIPLLMVYILILKSKHYLITTAVTLSFLSATLMFTSLLVVLLISILDRPYGAGIPHASFFLTVLAVVFVLAGGVELFKARNAPGIGVSSPKDGFTNQTVIAMDTKVPTSNGVDPMPVKSDPSSGAVTVQLRDKPKNKNIEVVRDSLKTTLDPMAYPNLNSVKSTEERPQSKSVSSHV